MKKLLLIVVIIGCLTAGLVEYARGFSAGISGLSGRSGVYCSLCHNTGIVPDVVLNGPASVEIGQTYTYTLVISGGQEVAGGLDVAVTAGLLTAVFTDTQLLNDEITHTAPKLVNEDGDVVFTFQWTAPANTTAVTMYGAGNSVNLDGTSGGDAANRTTLAITINFPHSVYLPLVTASEP